MPDAIKSQRGPLHAIDDQTTRGELRKLWDRVEGQTGLATLDDLKALERKLGNSVQTAIKPGFVNTTISDGSGNGFDLRPLDNRWTGHNVWDRAIAGKDDYTAQFSSLRNFPILLSPSPPEGQILLDKGYSALIDVRKSSANELEAASPGGNAAIYVQHRIDGTVAPVNNVSCGIRVQLETQQNSIAPVNDAAAGYFGILSKGTNVGAFGVHVDLYHRSLGSSISFGFDAELMRWSLDGRVVGFHARTVADGVQGLRPVDSAFLASPGGAGNLGFGSVFQGGSDFTGLLQCRYGLDLALASCDVAAITIPHNTRFLMNGKSPLNVGFMFDDIGKIQFFSDVGNTFGLGNDGTLFFDRANTSATASSPAGGVTMPNPMGFLVVNLGGFYRKLAFWNM